MVLTVLFVYGQHKAAVNFGSTFDCIFSFAGRVKYSSIGPLQLKDGTGRKEKSEVRLIFALESMMLQLTLPCKI